MPVVRIDLWQGRSPEMKEELIVKVTDAVCESLEVQKEDVFVILNEVSKDNWGMHGKTAAKYVAEKEDK
ncbi:MAG TPA: 4-oxalocrotonate tautomerase [Candidatus Altiarchaeales archaeon]|nr:4-oxalocrotonate tautomerase [Candidatus Altiarchaeales archaeon]